MRPELLAEESVVQLIDLPDLSAWAMWDHGVPAPFYSQGRVTPMGDAAHATTPFQGQGAAQATEDALVLQTLLGQVRTNTKCVYGVRSGEETTDSKDGLDE